MIQEIQSLEKSPKKVCTDESEKAIGRFYDPDLNKFYQAGLENNFNITIPDAVRLCLIRYFESRGENPPQILFRNCSQTTYFDYLSYRALINVHTYDDEDMWVSVILLLLDSGFEISKKHLNHKTNLLIYHANFEAARRLFNRLGSESISYGILYAAVLKNNIDIVRYILERTNSFDFAETRSNADQCIIFIINYDNVDMLDLLMDHWNKLVFSEHIRRRAHESAIRLGNNDMIDKIDQVFPL